MSVKKIFMSAAVLLSVAAAPLCALDEYVSDAYRAIDSAFKNRSADELNSVLEANCRNSSYYLIEGYTEKKIRRLIVNSDYEFAMNSIIALIDNNLDNEQAVEMYTAVADAYQVQLDYEAEKERKRQAELARIQAEMEKQRSSAEKEFVSVKTASGSDVYVSEREAKRSSYNWKIAFGMADLAWLAESDSELNAFKDGVSAMFSYEYVLPRISFGADVFADFKFLSIGESENSILSDIEFVPKIAFRKFSKNFFVRAGAVGMITAKSKSDVNSPLLATFISPVAGISCERVKIGGAAFSAGLDYYAGHLYTEELKFAAGAAVNLQIPFAELEQIKLNLNVGLRDKFFVKQGGIENRASLIFAVGVENVVR